MYIFVFLVLVLVPATAFIFGDKNCGVLVTALTFLACSAACFATVVYIDSDWNRVPVVAPLPGPGQEVNAIFTITMGDAFDLDAEVPDKPGTKYGTNLKELPPIKCNFDLTIKGKEGFEIRSSIKYLKHSGGVSWAKTSLFSGPEQEISRGGDYKFQLINSGCADPAQFTGGLIKLVRAGEPSGQAIEPLLMRSLGWITFVTGIICALLSLPSLKNRCRPVIETADSRKL